MQTLLKIALAVFVICAAVFWWLSRPLAIADVAVIDQSSSVADIRNGETVFWAGGCASCHASKDAKGEEKLLLGGGHRLNTPFGTFVTPNISPDNDTGLGNWDELQFANAMKAGVSRVVGHYYPSFPYASYNKMKPQDVADLFAYLKSLPPVSRRNEMHELPLPFQWRRPLGIWKMMFTDSDWAVSVEESNDPLIRGRYLVEALGHCGECHTPRNILGGMKKSQWLAGGPAPEGTGKIPNITSHPDGIGGWSEDDIVYYLQTGFTPDFDSVGSSMVSVQENMAKLPESDLRAIATYLKTIPPLASN